MGVVGWTWLLVAASFALYAGIAVYASARSTAAYYVADRSVHPVVNGMATGSDWMSAASFMSMAGIVAFAGRDGAAYLMGWTGGYVLLAVLLAPYLRKYGKYTVPQFVGDRYYSSSARAVATVCALVVSFTYVAGQMRGVGIVLARFLDLPIGAGVAVAMAVVFVYAVLGGMKGVTYTQVAQYAVLITAFLVPAILVARTLTGNPFPPLALGDRLTREGAALLGAAPGTHLLAALDGIARDLGFPRYTGGWRPRLDVFMTTAALMVGTAGLPHIIIRFFTVPKIRDARASAGWALLFIAVLYTTAPAVAAFGRGLAVESLRDVAHAERPDWWRAWEGTGLVGWTDRNGDGRMQYAADPAVNEVRLDHDVLVLAHPEIARLPAWVVGLVAAGALAAGLATAAGLLLVIAAAVAHDLLKSVLVPRLSDRAELWWARGAAAAAALGAGWAAVRPPGHVAEVVAIAFGFAASSFFPVLVLGIFWRRATKEGAVAGMIAGLATTAAYVAWFKHVHPELDVPASWWLGISPEGFGTVGMLVNAAVLVGVSLATRPPPPDVQELVAGLRYPREPAPRRASGASPR
jgi:cation/acetate symporter